eukprot:TRINITY_DN67576_c0_g1_i1.p1 TRINITY_DN67576_c0_g1~~TRINITY_DN67576_c0_g1_i1.p1  ORF type:complete len:308 (-),score=70.20 TRINITY_DN67576_c0_g1_i1:171-1094(-)
MPDASASVEDSGIDGVKVVVNHKLFTEEILNGKRVLHVKGFGTGFEDATAAQKALAEKQNQEALDALVHFRPDYIVVDGDPWGRGFQEHIKRYLHHRQQHRDDLPELIWAKNVKMSMPVSDGGQPVDTNEKDRRLKQAAEWAQQCGTTVMVYWIGIEQVQRKVVALYGGDALKSFEGKDFNVRGLIRLLSNPQQTLTWMEGLSQEMKAAIEAVEDAGRGSQRFFEKCSFENSAKGNVIFEVLESSTIKAHGAATFGGGESVVLELATKYLNSAVPSEEQLLAVFPHRRGRDGDPNLPHCVGCAFKGE